MNTKNTLLEPIAARTFEALKKVREATTARLNVQEVGELSFVGQGIARIRGLPTVQAEELVRLGPEHLGLAFNLEADSVGVILLDAPSNLAAGTEVTRTGRVLDVPVGEALLGRVIDALGRPLDQQGALQTLERLPVERPAPTIMDRSSVSVPLQTGLKVIDALIPIGRGQRELILGDRQTGKTSLALDTIINQHNKNVICIYCAIGQRRAAVAKVIADLEAHDALSYSIIVVANGDDPPGLQYIAPYAATTIAEYFMMRGHDVLIVYDDLTRHARAYRELSLLLRRPPGREAFPGDIFYIHSRLLERATHLSQARGGGSLTALPIIETEAQNLAAYIPTNLISITDGQIYLSPSLFQKGILPAVDVGLSVSRVGGKAQLRAYKRVAGTLRLSYSQFEELETFARFGTRLEEATLSALERGQRVREVLKQAPYKPLEVSQQLISLLAVSYGLFDELTLLEVDDAETLLQQTVVQACPHFVTQVMANQALTEAELEPVLMIMRDTLKEREKQLHHASP